MSYARAASKLTVTGGIHQIHSIHASIVHLDYGPIGNEAEWKSS